MPRMSPTALNAGVNAIVALATYGSLHTGDPGTTGATEYAGVTRVANTWNTAAAGAATNASSETYTTSGATPVPYFGEWNAASAGTYEFGGQLGATITAPTISIAAGAKSLTGS